ncbi:MAG: hypothetical protein ACRDQ7_03060 [Haloechinothrix sp.]
MSTERRHHIGLYLRRPATVCAEQLDVLRRAYGHTVELDRMTAAQDEATITHRIQRDPGQPCLECIQGVAKLREPVLPQRADLPCREEATPVAAQELPVEQAPQVRLLPLLQQNLVHRSAVIIVVEVILSAAAPGNVARKGDDAVIRSLQVVKPRRHRIRLDVRDAEGAPVMSILPVMTAM